MIKEWKNGRVGELIASLESGISVNGEDGTPSNDDYAVLKVSAVTYGKFNPQASKKITGSELQRAKCNPKKGQIIISRSNTPDLVGASCYVSEDYPNRFLPDKLWQTVPHPEKKVEHKWLAYFLASPWARFRLSKLATGTSNSMKNITKSELLTLPIPIPPFLEQKKIASFLECWDNAIEKTETLIAAKEKQFEWLTSNLINRVGHKRTSASGLMTEVSKRNKNSTIERVLSVTNHSGFVLPEEQFERRVASANVSNYKVVEQGQYAYNPSRINVGSIARLDDWENGILSPMYVVFKLDTKRVCSDYFLHWLNSSEARQRIKNSAQGSVRETVSFKDLGAINIPLPAMDVQKDVTYKLNLAQMEISLLKKTLEQYRSQKRGLMQKLLTGEWQVGSSQHLSEETCQELSKESIA
ncbi:type I restriction enzyme, S subunit [Colwellia chukchiensis]|uniref:Type I restriction enzyme, S subunit n=1 Tax=Colwellia chukchiensis TaxID=641665 RepID=A0A1H7PXQ5_9GAMM|nr:restriction endonuclease subunit S [Colwellia chukchiensis]SEL40513.1 type I restriction enzyme, S subunit [Colwellia chukchiensis]